MREDAEARGNSAVTEIAREVSSDPTECQDFATL
jgi:hypothetical protein